MDIGALRKEYTRGGLHRDDLRDAPMEQFRIWFDQAREAGLPEPNAMVLATVGEDGQPSQRTVLLKAYDSAGFVFFTNYRSRKAREIEGNGRVGLCFPWFPLERQVTIRGNAEKISRKESLRYFLSRPVGSRLGAWVSDQSSVISSRKILEMKLGEIKRKFSNREIPLPDFWGGFRVVPVAVEFWQGRESRLHDRFEYVRREGDSWDLSRLSP